MIRNIFIDSNFTLQELANSTHKDLRYIFCKDLYNEYFDSMIVSGVNKAFQCIYIKQLTHNVLDVLIIKQNVKTPYYELDLDICEGIQRFILKSNIEDYVNHIIPYPIFVHNIMDTYTQYMSTSYIWRVMFNNRPIMKSFLIESHNLNIRIRGWSNSTFNVDELKENGIEIA